jgi:hypothetical protein
MSATTRWTNSVTVTIDLSAAEYRWVCESAADNDTTKDEVIGLVARVGICEQIERFGSEELKRMEANA